MVIRSRKSKMDRRHNDQKKTTIYKTSHRKQQSTKHHTENNDLQNITQKTKDRATRIQYKPGVYSCVLKGQAVFAQHVTPVALLMLQTR